MTRFGSRYPAASDIALPQHSPNRPPLQSPSLTIGHIAARAAARHPCGRDAGFSLVETLVVLTIGVVLAAIATMQIGAVRPSMQGDSAMRVVMSQLNQAREMAIAQRRNMELQFIVPNGIRIVRHDVPNGTTVVSAAVLEDGAEFQLLAGAPDTPDGFGNATAIDFGAANAVMFTSDGTLIDDVGNPVDGTVFLMLPSGGLSARAVSILGATGRVKGYRWNGSTWSTD